MFKKISILMAIIFLTFGFRAVFAEVVNSSGDLTVNISNIKSNAGTIKIALFNTNESYRRSGNDGSGAYKTASLKISPDGTAFIIFKNLPYGIYGIKLFQDEDNSGELKTDWLGRPKEDFGFSNNIDGKSGVPDFEPVQFKVGESQTIQAIKMQRALVK